MPHDKKHAYEAEIEVPLNLWGGDLDKFIEALREQGHPKLIVRIPADSKAEAAALLADSTEHWDRGTKYDDASWHRRLTIIRSQDARRRAGTSFGGDQEI